MLLNPNQEIYFVKHKERLRYLQIPYAFCYNRDRKHKWLQKICLYILEKLGCYHYDVEVSITKVPIKPQQTAKAILPMLDNIYQQFGCRPKICYIGPEDFEVIGNQLIEANVNFVAQYWRENTLYGLKIEIIPWMKGILLV